MAGTASREEILYTMQVMSAGIGRALTREGIGGQLVRAVQGPMVMTFQVALDDPSRTALNAARALGPVVEAITHYDNVRVYQSNGMVVFEFPSPVPCPPHALELLGEVHGTSIPVGIDQWNNVASVNLRSNPAVMVIGPTGSGKSTVMRSMLYYILHTLKGEAEVVVASVKTDPWSAFDGAAGFLGIIRSGDSLAVYLESSVQRMNEDSNRGGVRRRHLLLIDDFINFMGENKDIAPLIKAMVSLGREVGYYTILGLQTAGSRDTSGGFGIEDNVMARIVFSAASKHAATRATGQSVEGSEKLSGFPGDALLIMNGRSLRIATPMITNAEIKALPQGSGKASPLQEHTKPVGDLPPLPHINPARAFNVEERAMLLAYLEAARKRGEAVSQRMLVSTIYGSRNKRYTDWVKEAIGEILPV